MIRALGVSQNSFDPADPGRLCRGRERWIDPWDGDEPVEMYRLVLSGAAFTDDSARDAQRGLVHTGIDLATLITTMFPKTKFVAWTEDGHPADIPEGAEAVEAYTGWQAGGRVQEARVRWHLTVKDAKEIRAVLGAQTSEDALPHDGDAAEKVRGFAPLDPSVSEEELIDRLFLLCGMSTLDSPPARYQPAAFVDVLDLVPAVLVLHRDKHGSALAVYSRDPIELNQRVIDLCKKHGVLYVPFAIPPMLARWDRALTELREGWTGPDPFPVPESPDGRWEPRRRRRWRDRPESDLEEQPVAPESPEGELIEEDDEEGGEDELDDDDDEADGDEPEGDEPDEEEPA